MIIKTVILVWMLLILLSISATLAGNNMEELKIWRGRKPLKPKPGPKPGSKINCACGKGLPAPGTPKIVGGKLSENHMAPWIGALVQIGGLRPSQFCGSSLINDRYVVTAGHCVVGKTGSVSGYQVFLGSNKINGTDAKRFNIASINLHPGYNSQTLENDIALIRLTDIVKFSPKIRPVCLAQTGTFAGRMANVAGWGTQAKGGNPVNQLRNAWVKVMENPVCAKNYTTANVKITQNMVCASLPGKDSCSGDSGGPLVVKENGDTFRQVGIVSFGVDCGNTHYPGVYARVTRYHKWIMDNTKDASYCSK